MVTDIRSIGSNDEACPQDASHSLSAHEPGGSWYGRGHDGLPSPWPSNETVNHPQHYNSYKGLEIIDLVEQMNFNRGNAVKYIARAGLKNKDTEIEDLRKAAWYLQREIERLETND